MAGARSSKEDFKDYFRVHNTLHCKTTVRPPSRESSKVLNKNISCHVQRIKSTDQVRCSRALRGCDWFSITNVFDTKSKQKTAANLRFTAPEPISQTPKVSSDKPKSDPQLYARRGSFRKAGYQPGLFSYTREKEPSKISRIRLRKPNLSDDILTVRPVECTSSLFQRQQVGSELSEREGSSGPGLLGRFLVRSPGPECAGKSCTLCDRRSAESRLVHQSRQVGSESYKKSRVSRNYLGCSKKSKEAAEREDRPGVKRRKQNFENESVVMEIRDVLNRKARVRLARDSLRAATHQAYAESGQEAFTGPTRSKSCSDFSDFPRMSLVGSERQKARKNFCAGTDDVCFHRRIQRRMGCPDERLLPFGSMDGRSAELADQQKRALYGLDSSAEFSRCDFEPVNYDTVRQQNSSSVPAQSGGYKVCCTFRNDERNFNFGPESRYDHSLILSAGSVQLNRRLLVQGETPSRLASQKRDHRQDIWEVGNSSDRFICHKSIKSCAEICLNRCEGSPSSLHQRIQPNMELRSGLDFPSSTLNSAGASAPKQVIRDVSDRGTSMGDSVLEERPQTQSSGVSIHNTQPERELNRLIHEPPATEGGRPLFGGMEDTGWSELVADLDRCDIDLIQSAWRDSTWRTYRCAWKLWVSWCRQNGRKPSSPRPHDVAAYLGSLSRIRGLAPSTILVHKSVILTFADPTREKQLRNHPLVTAMVKAIKTKKCLSTVSKAQIWNVQDLVQWLKSNLPDKESIFQVSRHVALLLLLASGRRVHDLTLLMIDDQHCERSDSSITFWPRFGSKTDNDKNRQSGWQLTCSGDPRLSLVKWVDCLIEISKNRRKARSDLHNLFITTRGTVKAASRTVIAGWLKTSFKEIGISCSPGSVRAAVASNDFHYNVPLDDILKRGNWRGSSNFFKHYCKAVEQPRGRNVNVLNDSFNAV